MNIAKVVVVGILTVSLFLVACANAPENQPKDNFEQILGIPIEPKLQIQVIRNPINPYDHVALAVWNDTNEPIYFPDDTLGVRAFKYDPQTAKWTPSELTPRTLNHNTFTLLPSDQDPNEAYLVLPYQWRVDRGTLRFVIVGSQDPIKSDAEQVAAYVQVEISEENPSFLGNWIQSNGMMVAAPDERITHADYFFQGDHAQVIVQQGPTYGAMALTVEGEELLLYCNFSESESHRTIEIEARFSADQMVRIDPINDLNCNKGTGSTGIIEFKTQ